MYKRQLVKSKIVKAGVAFPRDVLKNLDDLIRKLGIPNRSKAVVEATMKYITENMWVYEDGIAGGALSIIYDDTNRKIQSKLLEIRNMYSHIINATINLALDHNKLVDVWIVKGHVRVVRRLIEAIEKINGVYTLRTIIVHRSSKTRY